MVTWPSLRILKIIPRLSNTTVYIQSSFKEQTVDLLALKLPLGQVSQTFKAICSLYNLGLNKSIYSNKNTLIFPSRHNSICNNEGPWSYEGGILI